MGALDPLGRWARYQEDVYLRFAELTETNRLANLALQALAVPLLDLRRLGAATARWPRRLKKTATKLKAFRATTSAERTRLRRYIARRSRQLDVASR